VREEICRRTIVECMDMQGLANFVPDIKYVKYISGAASAGTRLIYVPSHGGYPSVRFAWKHQTKYTNIRDSCWSVASAKFVCVMATSTPYREDPLPSYLENTKSTAYRWQQDITDSTAHPSVLGDNTTTQDDITQGTTSHTHLLLQLSSF